MDERRFHRAVTILSGQHSLAFLRYLSGGEWRIASETSRALGIHTTTASNFLAAMHGLGFLERRVRKSPTRRTDEYRWPTPHLFLGLEFHSGPPPILGALDYYLEYASNVIEKSRRLGWPGIKDRLEFRLFEKDRSGLKERLFSRILGGGGAQGMDELKTLFRDLHREFLEISSEAMGAATARRILAGATDEAGKGHEELVDRYDLREVLEG